MPSPRTRQPGHLRPCLRCSSPGESDEAVLLPLIQEFRVWVRPGGDNRFRVHVDVSLSWDKSQPYHFEISGEQLDALLEQIRVVLLKYPILGGEETGEEG